MKVKTIKEVLILIKDNRYIAINQGMCISLANLLDRGCITQHEKDKTNRYMKKNRPKKTLGRGSWWWFTGLTIPRIDWLHLHIAKLSKS